MKRRQFDPRVGEGLDLRLFVILWVSVLSYPHPHGLLPISLEDPEDSSDIPPPELRETPSSSVE